MDTIQEAIEFLSLMEEPEYVSEIVALRARVAELEARAVKRDAELERERMCHAGCGVIAGANTQESLERVSKGIHQDYLSASVQECIRAARREIDLRERIAKLEPMAEFAAIMAVCGYFSRMRRPDAYETRWAGKGGPYAWGTGFLHKVYPDRVAKGTEIRALYAGSAPVPAVDDDALLDMARQLVAAEEELAEMTERKDAAYFERNQVVAALAKCFPSIVTQTEIPGWSPEWHGCVYIQLPTGQVSWHFHESQEYLFAELPRKGAGWDGWDGHDTDEKYRRVNSIPVPAVPQAVDVDAICNAYESGVGHRGRPTALINPYPAYSVEAFAYSLGANGIDAAIAKHKEGSGNA